MVPTHPLALYKQNSSKPLNAAILDTYPSLQPDSTLKVHKIQTYRNHTNSPKTSLSNEVLTLISDKTTACMITDQLILRRAFLNLPNCLCTCILALPYRWMPFPMLSCDHVQLSTERYSHSMIASLTGNSTLSPLGKLVLGRM